MLHGVREEVGVDEDGIGRLEGGVVLEEERGRHLRAGAGLVGPTRWASRAYISRMTSSAFGLLCLAAFAIWFFFLHPSQSRMRQLALRHTVLNPAG